ncbi:MAG: MBL fold metallo-hydrolase [Lachnospiraceae bacterium]
MKKPFYTFVKVTDRITAIRSACGEILYLIEGRDRALLVDTNLGVRGLRELVDALTDREITVLITHGHIDHAPGAPAFADLPVYLNPLDIPLYRRMDQIGDRDGYIRANLGADFAKYDLRREDYIPEDPDFPFLTLSDGQVFDLGDLHAEAVAFPGHTKGSMAVYLPELRTLITGDCCNNATFLFDQDAASVSAYRDTVCRLRDRFFGKLDHIYLCHHVMEAGTALLSDMAEVCETVLSGRADDLPFSFMGQQACIAMACNARFERRDGGFANLIYRRDHLYDDNRA